ncbi:MAG: hypothetical protein FWD57_00995 [Polyangiaceae bacterium]|nr:hypothetical protein [Polyangiaceae bacterium]
MVGEHTNVFGKLGLGRLFVAASVLVCGGALVLGCDEGFDPASLVNNVRVIGVMADNPYPRPGDTVEFSMLWHDGGSPVGSPRDMQIVWIGGCHNPKGDYYSLCYPQMAEQLEQLGGDPSRLSPSQLAGKIGFGEKFSISIPSDIVSSRPETEGVEPYGLSYVFYVVCAGKMGVSEPGEDGLPFGCFGDNGDKLTIDDYVIGYHGIYSYDKRTNANPIVTGFSMGGRLMDSDDIPKFPVCAKGSCSDLQIKLNVDPSSAENTGLKDPNGKEMTEQMWVEYLATGGEIHGSHRLVNDGVRGWNEDNGTDYTPPGEVGKQVIFAVVRDNRGGVAWWRQVVEFE